MHGMLSTFSQVFFRVLVNDLNLLIKWEVLKVNSSWMLKLAQLKGVVRDVRVGLFVVVISRAMTLYLTFLVEGWEVRESIVGSVQFCVWFVCYMYLTPACIGIDVGDPIWYYQSNIRTEKEDCGRVVVCVNRVTTLSWHDSWWWWCSNPLSYRPHLVYTGSIPRNTLNKTFPLPSHFI
jgi:hypothetical protein